MHDKVLLLIAAVSLMYGARRFFGQICYYDLPNDKCQLTYFLLLVFRSILPNNGPKLYNFCYFGGSKTGPKYGILLLFRASGKMGRAKWSLTCSKEIHPCQGEK
jgi:hypothetical protein